MRSTLPKSTSQLESRPARTNPARRRHLQAVPWVIVHVILLVGCASCSLRSPDEGIEIEEHPGANPWSHLRVNDDPGNFQFAIIGDLTGRLRPNVFPEAVRKLNLLQPEFVVTIGDLIEGHTNDAARLNREWDEFFKAIEPLQMPIFYVPGNHDYFYRSTQGPAGKPEVFGEMAAVYKQRLGRSYYHFVYRNVLFLMLNNPMEDPQEIEEERRYIARTLRQHRDVRWTFTFFHYEQFRDGAIWEYMKPLLGDRPFTAFAGHSHTYLKYEDARGREMIRLATTGGMSRMRGPQYGEFDHIMLVTMTDRGPRLANLLLDGIRNTNIRTERSERMRNLLMEGTRGGGSPFNAETVFVKGDVFNGGATKVTLTNRAELPLRIQGTIEPTGQLRAEPPNFDLEVPANSSTLLNLELHVARAIAVQDLETPIVNWRAGYTLGDGDPYVEVVGSNRIIIDTVGKEPARKRTVFTEKFSERLDPAWTPLGGGGTFEGRHYTLRDDAPALEGEEPDSAGRHTDGPLYNVAVHSPAQERVYRYTDGRGVFTTTPLFQLPVDGLYRDIPGGSFEANLKISGIRWKTDKPELHWEFWDSPDEVYQYGPLYRSGVIAKLSRDSGGYSLVLQKFTKTAHSATGKGYTYTDLGSVGWERAPSSLTLRATWRESTRTWRFFYGIDGAAAVTAVPGGEFIEDIEPSFEGKRNLIYVRKAEGQGGFAVELGEYSVRR